MGSVKGSGGGNGPPGTPEQVVEIDYPTDYAFKIIGRAADDFSSWAQGEVAAALQIDIEAAAVSEQPSSKGTYVSVEVTVRLTSEEQRRAVYARLHGHPRIVLYL